MKYILAGKRYKKILEKSLENQGFSTFWLDDNPDVDPRLAGHIDLSIFKYGSHLICAKNCDLAGKFNCEIISNRIIRKAAINQGLKYPNDANLCALTGKGWIMHNSAITDPVIKEAAADLEFIHINQGYARCTALSFGDAVITADDGIENACRANGIDVLKISTGGIALDGFQYGFIGGASFTADNTVYFTGKLIQDEEIITQFLRDRGYSIVYLTNEPIFDIGGVILL